MFYAMMTVFFVRNGDRLSRLVALLMGTIAVQCLAVNFFMLKESYVNDYWWDVQSLLDMLAVPMYTFVLMELVKPGRQSVWNMIFQEAPFLILAVLFIVSGNNLFYHICVAWAGILGNFFLIWTMVQIPRYHRRLREHFSYTDNIALHWLWTILISFYIILGLWIVNCVAIHLNVEALYMLLSTAMWMAICYFINKHEQVIDELKTEPDPQPVDEPELSELGVKIERLFRDNQIFLNPNLKVSDVAAACNTNRTYVSNYFNREAGVTFYEYVNMLRIDYACSLLLQGNDAIKIVAEQSGFNSSQSFIRTFIKMKGMKPTDFRNSK